MHPSQPVTTGPITAELLACEVCGDCLVVPPVTPPPGEPAVLLGGIWCKNLIVVKEKINVIKNGQLFNFLFTEKLPFELLMLRVATNSVDPPTS